MHTFFVCVNANIKYIYYWLYAIWQCLIWLGLYTFTFTNTKMYLPCTEHMNTTTSQTYSIVISQRQVPYFHWCHKWSRDFSKKISDNSRLFYSRIAICMNKHSKGTKLHCMLYLENKFLQWRCFSLYHDVTMQKKGRWWFINFFLFW